MPKSRKRYPDSKSSHRTHQMATPLQIQVDRVRRALWPGLLPPPHAGCCRWNPAAIQLVGAHYYRVRLKNLRSAGGISS